MALSDQLIEVFNSNNFFVLVSVCVAVGAVLLFTVLKWLSKSDERRKVASVDVDDWDKEIQKGLKKTKHKKVKASTNAQSDNGSNSSRSKVTGKQATPTKLTAPPAKEKQANEKASAKKQAAASTPSRKSVQPTNEAQGEWMLAGPKKKQKTKKTVKESKTKDQADRQTKDVEETETHKSVADVVTKDVEPLHEAQVGSHELEVAFEARESVCDTPAKDSSLTEDVVRQLSKCNVNILPVSSGIEDPVEVAAEARVDGGNTESDLAGKEIKSKKSSKKKKPKVVADPAQVTDLVVPKTAVAVSRQEDDSETIINIPSGSVAKPESVQRVETIHKSDEGPVKGTSKDVITENAKVLDASNDVAKVASNDVVKIASMDVVKVASKGVAKVDSKDVAADASKHLVSDPSKITANDASKGVVTSDSQETVPEASKDGPASQQVAFDELGLKESSMDVGQSVLKKKKKARKDI